MPHRLLFAILVLATLQPSWGGTPDWDRQLHEALTEVTYFSFDRGYSLFKAVLAEAPEGSPTWQQAVFGAGVCAHQMTPASAQHIAEATSLYQLLLQKTPHSQFAPRARMNLGRIAELKNYLDDKVDLERARTCYQQVVAGWPNEPIAGEATLRIAATYIQTYDAQQVRQGITLLEQWLAAHPKDELASAMWQYLGDTYFCPVADYPKALAAYRRADALGFVEKGREGPIFWKMAVLADRYVQDRDLAVEYYTRIIQKTPTSGKAYEAQLALKRLGAPVPPIELFHQDEAPTRASQASPGPTEGKP